MLRSLAACNNGVGKGKVDSILADGQTIFSLVKLDPYKGHGRIEKSDQQVDLSLCPS